MFCENEKDLEVAQKIINTLMCDCSEYRETRRLILEALKSCRESERRKCEEI